MSTFGGFSVNAQLSSDNEPRTLIEYVGKGGIDVGDDLVILIDHLQYACKKIAALIASPFNSSIGKCVEGSGNSSGTDRDAPKPLDIVSVWFLFIYLLYFVAMVDELPLTSRHGLDSYEHLMLLFCRLVPVSNHE